MSNFREVCIYWSRRRMPLKSLGFLLFKGIYQFKRGWNNVQNRYSASLVTRYPCSYTQLYCKTFKELILINFKSWESYSSSEYEDLKLNSFKDIKLIQLCAYAIINNKLFHNPDSKIMWRNFWTPSITNNY